MLRQGTFTKDKKVVLPPTGQVWVNTDNDGNIIPGGGGGTGSGDVTVTNWPENQKVTVTSAPWRNLPDAGNKSGRIVAANTWQKLTDRNPLRKDLTFQLIEDEAEIWLTPFYVPGMAAGDPGCYRLQTGSTYWATNCNELWIISTKENAAFTCEENDGE